MAKFSNSSLSKLETVHPDLQTVFCEVINHFDCTVVYGRRLAEEQFELFKKGRRKNNKGDWIIWEADSSKVVTFKDGFKKKSRHQPKADERLSDAVDVVPYPIEWNNTNRMLYFIGFVLGTARMLKAQGKITHDIISGVDWDNDTILKDHSFSDYPHFQIKRK